MQLTELQLECQRLGAYKNLSLGCIFADKYHRDNSDSLQYNTIIYLWDKYEWVIFIYYTQDFMPSYIVSKAEHVILWERKRYRREGVNEWDFRYEIIWHPITYSRLCYLYRSQQNKKKKFIELSDIFLDSPILLNQTILERDEETCKVVRDFLLSIEKNPL